jgi:hypothetical protein
MKKYDRHFLILGSFLTLLPIYDFFGWIYSWNRFIDEGRDKVIQYFFETIFFNLFDSHLYPSLIIAIIGIFAFVLILISLVNSLEDKSVGLKKLKILALLINLIFTTWMLWGLM